MKNLSHASYTQLRRIFTPHEINTCWKDPSCVMYRLATRFAAKEATLKALSQHTTPPAFLTLCQIAWVDTTTIPRLHISWYPHLTTSISLTHTDDTATAIVVIYP